MTEPRRPSPLAWFDQHQITKIVVYYLALGVAVALLYRLDPDLPGVFSTKVFEASGGAAVSKDALREAASNIITMTPLEVAFETMLMMLGAVLLMLPVAWVHILTRSRKGFNQSTVQTLIFLPLIVAGVLMLVQHSIALAFGLGGIVGAVGFRNRLEDPKDAMYIFAGIAVGLSAGVQVLAVAAVISVFFNLVVLYAWRFDFGRMPAMLEVGIAQKRMDRVKAGSQAPADFLRLVDQHLLKSMTPDQLQALAERASSRGKKATDERDLAASDEEEKREKFDSMLRIMMQPDDAPAVRQAIEQVLAGQTKRWEFEKAGSGEGGRATAQYKVRFKKSIPSTLVVESMRRSVLPKVVTIDVRDA